MLDFSQMAAVASTYLSALGQLFCVKQFDESLRSPKKSLEYIIVVFISLPMWSAMGNIPSQRRPGLLSNNYTT
jgi:hypothetical protein